MSFYAQIGDRRARIVPKDTWNGSVKFLDGNATMTVGTRGLWVDFLGVAMHEVFELALIQERVVYRSDTAWQRRPAELLYVMPHAAMSEAIDTTAHFLAKHGDDLRSMFDRAKDRERKKEEKKKRKKGKKDIQ